MVHTVIDGSFSNIGYDDSTSSKLAGEDPRLGLLKFIGSAWQSFRFPDMAIRSRLLAQFTYFTGIEQFDTKGC
jgi:hypothetical protein